MRRSEKSTPVSNQRHRAGAAALLAVGAAYLAVEDRIMIGPPWLALAVVAALLVPSGLARLRGHHDLARRVMLTATTIVTFTILGSAAILVRALPGGGTPAPVLLRDAALIWAANVAVFAVWYWEIDAGGLRRRHLEGYCGLDFVFPQCAAGAAASDEWTPRFVDYLFLSFNTSTALSPTDTLVLSARAKILMMVQSLISLAVLAVLAARAINTL
ncbi:MAG: DUF1345 domain-containing protein [Chloroflexota bacterium]|nr:MAG: DUF1345 domain-containing protein [Chloroflexota bacterium]